MDSIFQSPSAPQKLKELESNKIDFVCIYNDVSSGISDLGCSIRLKLEDTNYVLPWRLVLYSVNLAIFSIFFI